MDFKKIITIIVSIIAIFFIYNAIDEHSKMIAELRTANAQLINQNKQLVEELAKAKKDYMELTTSQSSTTAASYIPKESKDDGDVEVIHMIPKVVVFAGDDHKYDITPQVKSSEVIEDGKIVIKEQTYLNLDIEKIVDARFKDKIEAMEVAHKAEKEKLKAENEQLRDKLGLTRRQRDFYAAGMITGGVGIVISRF